jgi:hypothetical protein
MITAAAPTGGMANPTFDLGRARLHLGGASTFRRPADGEMVAFRFSPATNGME